ncbi:hypothetical protein CTAYLR_010566 [Chrysophaeum taylorii]|uniref:Serine/threonine-protein phosphatase 2A 55 kDa regulatory subunit B n=1 Tax=Chrysophaeum taylorii TaxID=2483200 RepID=A0AAD7UH73_9STRA|nr:hypothetical protein CTAYLR_010566 [Chrysophaeum taylorii]
MDKVTTFKSHDPEFDYLKSLEIEEKINKVKFCLSPATLLLTTNDKTIKLWRVGETATYSADRQKRSELGTTLKRVFGNAHAYHVNSISLNSDGETFASSDDLRVNLWNLDISTRAFNIIDLKPPNMEDLAEVITSTTFHPDRCFQLMYASSKGTVNLFDLRLAARPSPCVVLGGSTSESFFSEIVVSVSDAKFAADHCVLARDFLALRCWDLRATREPTWTVPVHDHLKPRLSDLYDSDRIFDKFECAAAGNLFFTGSYSNHCFVFDYKTKATLSKPHPTTVDFEKRVLHLAATDTKLAFATHDTLYFHDLPRASSSTPIDDDSACTASPS